MELIAGLSKIFFYSLFLGFSGAVMPGPMFSITVSGAAARGFKTGPLVALGHVSIELFIVAGLFFFTTSMGAFLQSTAFTRPVNLIGGVVLIIMGGSMVWSIKTISLQKEIEKRNSSPGVHPYLGGILTSLSNPYFYIWWAAIGLPIFLVSMNLKAAGVITFYLGHISADFIWFGLVALIVAWGRRFINDLGYRVIIGICAAILIIFGGLFFYQGLTNQLLLT
jgi:threonine/homoserine/homoserine lactone efflux protein